MIGIELTKGVIVEIETAADFNLFSEPSRKRIGSDGSKRKMNRRNDFPVF
jgi:hypothetical protein